MIDVASWRRLGTAVGAGLRGIRGAPVVFSTSVITMTAGLMVLGGYLLVVENMRSTLTRLGEAFSVYAYLPTNVDPDEERVVELQGRFLGFEEVESVLFVSRDKALDQLRDDLGDLAGVMDGLSDNPLPASFELRLREGARTPERAEALVDRVRQIDGVEDTRYGAEWVGVYARVLRGTEITGLALGLGLFLVLSVIVGGTVRLAVYARADEIEIQRLVGAGGLYVRLPFYIQGSLQGAFGAVAALGLLYGLYALELPFLGAPLELLTGASDLRFFGLTGVIFLVFAGVGLGLAGAVLWLLRLEEA